jgi:PAS domain S-box-containing protein
MGADRPAFISVIRAIRGGGFFKSFGCGCAATGFIASDNAVASVGLITRIIQAKIQDQFDFAGDPMKTRRAPRAKRQGTSRKAPGRRNRSLATKEDILARKKTAELLRESEERFRNVFEKGGLGMAMGSLTDGRFIGANRTFCEMLGYTEEELKRLTFAEVTHPEHLDVDLDAIKRLLEGKIQKHRTEKRYLKKNGEVVWGARTLTRVRTANEKSSYGLSIIEDITEHKQALEALRASEERYRLLFEASADGIILVGSDGLITGANDAQSRMFHYDSPEEMVGMSPNLLVTPAMREFGRDIMRRRLSGEETAPVEYRLLRKDGTEFWGEVSAALLRSKSGVVTGYTCVTHDTTKRKRTEELLRESESRFRSLFEQAPIAISVSRNGRGVFANQGVVRTFGLRDAEEWVGRPTSEWLALQCQEESKERTRRRLLELPVPAEFESVGMRPDGSQFPIHVAVGRVLLADGPANIAFITDITERKQAEAALRAREADLAAAQRIAHIGSWIWDIKSDTARWSEETHRIFAVDRGQLDPHRQSFLSRVHSADVERVGQALTDALSGVRDYDLDYRIRLPDGTEKYIHAQAEVVRGDDGKPTVMQGTVQDITERKQAEAELRELSGRLLRLEDDERQRIARELHDTTAQELAAISMNLAVLKARAPELKAGTQKILAETIALTDRCASEVRTMSYLLHPPALEALGLAGAGRDYIDGFARRSGLRVDLEISGDFGRLRAETELALFRVLQESLVNIHRHSGSRKASIQLARTTDQIRLEVRDTGRGMKKTDNPLAEGPPAGGLGVGIPGMRERMRQLGGQLQIQSDAQGTCVVATVPVGPKTERP